jgi:hypothetical protein
MEVSVRRLYLRIIYKRSLIGRLIVGRSVSVPSPVILLISLINLILFFYT